MVLLNARAEALAQGLGEVLRKSRFKQQGNVFVRPNGQLLHLIDVQRSRWNDAKEIDVTLNCGVYVPGVTTALGNWPDPKQPKLPDCCIAARVGMLTDGKLDRWWRLSIEDEPGADEQHERELRAITEERVLPFLARFPDEEAAATFLSQPRASGDRFVDPGADVYCFTYAAVLWNRLGRKDDCLTYLDLALTASRDTPAADVVAGFEKRFRPLALPAGS